MAPPIYFLPGIDAAKFRPTGGRIADGLLADRRLDRVLADVPLGRMMVSNLHKAGPGDEMGLLLRAEPATSTGNLSPRFDYLPDDQTWQRVVDRSEGVERVLYWIGIDNAEPPKPTDLARLKTVDGYLVKLGDGQMWKIPLIRQPSDSGMPGTNLPCDIEYGWDDMKNWQTVKAEYLDIWERSANVFDLVIVGVQPQDGDGALMRQFAFDCLALNYRLGPGEVNRLRLLDNEIAAEINKVAVGYRFLEELIAKKNGTLPE